MIRPEQNIIITVDGYSSCGKSTFAKAIAKLLNYIYIDSGAMYRAIALYAMRHHIINGNEINRERLIQLLNKVAVDFRYNPKNNKFETFLNDENVEEEIRNIQISEIVSPVSAIHEVRERLVKLQREIGKNKGIVMDGRDIGTVVFPNADLKIFMTANVDTRAERRYKELINKGIHISIEEVKNNIETRDKIDTTRDVSPLRKADDALLLDNSNMTVQEQLEWFESIIESMYAK